MSLIRPRWVLLAATIGGCASILWTLLAPGTIEPAGLDPVDKVDAEYLSPVPLDLSVSSGLFAPMQGDEPMGGTMNGAVSPAAQPPRLVGLAARRGGQSVALAVDQSGQTRVLRPGEEIDGWRLTQASRDYAVFVQGTRRERVALDFANKGGGATAGAALPPSQQLMDTGVIGQ